MTWIDFPAALKARNVAESCEQDEQFLDSLPCCIRGSSRVRPVGLLGYWRKRRSDAR